MQTGIGEQGLQRVRLADRESGCFHRPRVPRDRRRSRRPRTGGSPPCPRRNPIHRRRTVAPARATRRISATAFAGSGTKFRTRPLTTQSSAALATGRSMAPPWRKSIRGSWNCCRARVRNPSDGSTPMTERGSQQPRIAWLSAPVPQPTSSQLPFACAPSPAPGTGARRSGSSGRYSVRTTCRRPYASVARRGVRGPAGCRGHGASATGSRPSVTRPVKLCWRRGGRGWNCAACASRNSRSRPAPR